MIQYEGEDVVGMALNLGNPGRKARNSRGQEHIRKTQDHLFGGSTCSVWRRPDGYVRGDDGCHIKYWSSLWGVL